MSISFEDHVAVVTGSGRGLGRAYALEMARRGAAVVVNDIGGLGSQEGSFADAVVREIQDSGGRAAASYDSIATDDGGRAVIDCALDAFGTVDIVINNAGFLRPGYVDELDVTAIESVLDVHLAGAFYVTRAAWPVMKEKGYGRVVFISSSAGAFGHEANSNYCAAKAGLLGLSRALALEGKRHGILCNAMLPFANTLIAVDNPVLAADTDRMNEYRGVLADRRSPATVVPLTVFLASRDCGVTGQAFGACSGRYGRVFLAIAPGWLAQDPDNVSVEDIAGHFEQIADLSGFIVPESVGDELEAVALAVIEAGWASNPMLPK